MIACRPHEAQLRFYLLCLLATGCAGAQEFDLLPGGVSPRLEPGAAVAPPSGLLAYCARVPTECGGLGALERPANGASKSVASARSALPAGADAWAFHALMATHAGMVRAESSQARVEVNLTPALWEELRVVSRDINRRIDPASDRAAHAVEEFWNRPLQEGHGGREVFGDCEDYALEKRAWLLRLGWAPRTLALAVGLAPGGGLHAVLVVQTDRGDFVLDNLTDEPLAVSDVNYIWVSRQVGADITTWAAAVGDTSAGE